MTEPWRTAADETFRRRQATRQVRAEQQRRRTRGLGYRNAQRLRRARGGELNREDTPK